MTDEELQQFIAAYRAVSSTPTARLGHGPGGLFSYPGLEPNLVNAMVVPQTGLLNLLPSRTSNDLNPLHGIVTGVTDITGSEPDGPCDDLPYAGLMKLCTHSAWWGFWGLSTRVYDIKSAGFRVNRAEFNDFNLVGGPSNNDLMPNFPGGGDSAISGALRSEAAKARFEFATSWARRWAKKLYTANPANNTANDGYMEPYGLDMLINTGYQDAVTGAACPAADSTIVDAGGLDIEADGAGVTVVANVTGIYRYVSSLAQDMGLAPATWALSMPRELFWALTEVWPCAYFSYRCMIGASEVKGLSGPSGSDLTTQRDNMRQGEYLLIDGQQVRVVFDGDVRKDEVELEPGTFESDIYFVPLRIVGNTPATYLEYFDWDGPNAAMQMAELLAPTGHLFTTNGGRYLWERKPMTNGCVQVQAWTRWRVILATPQLAARYQNLRFTPLYPLRDALPGDAMYVNGGSTEGPAAPVYNPPTA